MVESRSRDAVLRRLGEALGLESQIAAMLEGHQAEVREPAQAAVAIGQSLATALAQREALRARLEAVGAGATEPEGGIGPVTANSRWAAGGSRLRSASAVLQATASALAEAVAAYSSLFTTARLMFDGATCDLAQRHICSYARANQAINWLIPDVVEWELRQDDLACRCICPACSLGACLCVRASVDALRVGWGAVPPFGSPLPRPAGVEALLDEWGVSGLPTGRGVVLRSPRSGSQLAEAGCRPGDRILAVDGHEVSTNPELQTALRKHQIGDEVTLRVERRAGAVSEIIVRHVSDLPR